MAIQISGVQMGVVTGGPSSITLADLADVSIVSPLNGEYLRYNSSISEWQNAGINADLYSFLDTNLTSSNGVVLTKTPGPNTVNISLGLTASGDATGTVSSGNLPLTLATVNSNVGTFGSATTVPVITVNAKGLVTAISTATIAATTSTSLAGGTTGALPYQSAASTTAFLAAGTTSQVLVGGASSPAWSNTPTLTGTNFTGIPNAGLTNSSVTIGSTAISLGASSATLAGLTSVTATTFSGALSGNATTATTLQTARTIATSGAATGTATSFNGSANITIPITALDASSLSAGTVPNGRLAGSYTGITSVTSTNFVGALTGAASANVLKAGDTMTGLLVLSADPTAALGAATKQYVDNVAGGLNVHGASVTSTTAALPASTYNNGTAGVGATITATANGAIGTVGGYASLVVSDRVLVKDQASALQNGIYLVTQLGSAGSPWILTRTSDFDGSPASEVQAGDFTYISGGTLVGTQWVLVTAGTITVGTSALNFSQLSGAGTYVGGTGINVSSNIISNTGVTSLAGTANQISVSASTGAVTLSLPASITISGTATATTFSGALSGNATTATTATTTTGNAGTATTLQTARTIATSGAATGTATSFNGSANITIPITALDASSLSAGTVPSARITGAYTGFTSITASGTVTAATFNATSTKRVKKYIKDISKSTTDKFLQLRPREYDRKDYLAHEFGFIAEEMAEVYPEIVGTDSTGRATGIDYGKLSTILTAKVQEQQATINELKTQMSYVMTMLNGAK